MALNDIFVNRYRSESRLFENSDHERCRRFLRQFRLLAIDDIHDKIRDQISVDSLWTTVYQNIAHEFGEELSIRHDSARDRSFDHCIEWLFSEPTGKDVVMITTYNANFERYMVNGLSLIEMFFRTLEDWVSACIDQGRCDEFLFVDFEDFTNQLNQRLHQAGIPLYYDKGMLRYSKDAIIEKNIEEPFWEVVRDPKWNQANRHMKKAMDIIRYDKTNAVKEAALALESIIKEVYLTRKNISDDKHLKILECIDYLFSENVIAEHECKIMKIFFSKSRNPTSHAKRASAKGGPVEWSHDEAVWNVDFCMSTIRRLASIG